MANSKKILVRTVTFERFVLPRRIKIPSIRFCADCGRTTDMFPIDETAVNFGLSIRELFRLAENGTVHSLETENGQMMICRESLREIQKGVRR